MEAWLPEWGQAFTVLIMACALGMDAFSLGFGLGMRGVSVPLIMRVSAVIALFHVVMPLFGLAAGQYVSAILGHLAAAVGGGLLVLLGSHMICSAVKGEAPPVPFEINGFFGLLVFSLAVSIDSFSVGMTLGLLRSDVLFAVLAFGFMGGAMSVLGLAAGRRVGRFAGGFGEAVGGAILLAYGLKLLF